MDTVLNLGLNDQTVEALAELSGDRRFAYDSYRRFITMYSDVVPRLRAIIISRTSSTPSRTARAIRSIPISPPTTGSIWSARYKGSGGRRRPARNSRKLPTTSLWGAIGAVFSSWMNAARAVTYRRLHDIPEILGHRGQRAGHGVRQHGRHLGDRRCLYAQPFRPARASSMASS